MWRTRRSFRAARWLVAGCATGHAGASRQPEGRYRAGPGGPRMRAALRASSGSLGTPCGVPLSCLAAPAWRRFLFRADFWLPARIPMGRERSRLEPRGRPAVLGAIAGACPLAIGPDLLDLGPSVEGPPSRRRPLPRRERDPRPVASSGKAMIRALEEAGISIGRRLIVAPLVNPTVAKLNRVLAFCPQVRPASGWLSA